MITTLRKAKDTWVVKFVLILTAVSFMSLFGVSGYVTSRNPNKTAIKVGSSEITAQELYIELAKETNNAKAYFGDEFGIENAIQMGLLKNIVRKNTSRLVVKEKAKDMGVVISDEIARDEIFAQADFQNAEGKFDLYKFRRLIQSAGFTENRYIELLKADITKNIIVGIPAGNINVPNIMAEYINKYNNEKRIAKLINIRFKDINISGNPTQEDLDAYYSDYKDKFMIPESRDFTLVSVTADKILKNIEVNEEDAKQVYQEDINKYVTPEKRDILTMVFEKEEDARKAYSELQAGKDFISVASELAKQSADDTKLGYNSKDMLIADVAEDVFKLNKGEYIKPTKSEFGWHIMKVVDIKPMSKISYEQAKSKIIENLKKEKAYDDMYNVSRDLDDLIGGGSTLEDAAKETNLSVVSIKNMDVDGKVSGKTKLPKEVANLPELANTVYSYNAGEVSTIVEHDNGFFIVRVDSIREAEPKTLASIKSDLIKIWKKDEQKLKAQEVSDKIYEEVKNGKKINNVAAKYGFGVTITKPIKRFEKNRDISEGVVAQIFKNNIKTVDIAPTADGYVISQPTKILEASKAENKKTLEETKKKLAGEIYQDVVYELLTDYSSDFRVRIDEKVINSIK